MYWIGRLREFHDHLDKLISTRSWVFVNVHRNEPHNPQDLPCFELVLVELIMLRGADESDKSYLTLALEIHYHRLSLGSWLSEVQILKTPALSIIP